MLSAFPSQAASLPDQKQCRNFWDKSLSVKPEIEGWCLLIDSQKGNCLACHHVETPGWPSTLAPAGNAGPILTNLTNTYPDRNQLRDIIHDASQQFPDSFMPLYGKHLILEQNEINLIVKFLLTL
jgi:sulfur-oxidizing protein SoxX